MATTTKAKINQSDLALYNGVDTSVSRIDSTGGTQTSAPIGYYVNILSVYGSSATATNDSTLSTAINRISSRKTAFILNPGTWSITANLTIPRNVTLVIPDGATLDVDSGVTLTINGKIRAGIYEIFTGDGVIEGKIRGKHVYPEWWGAEGDDETDDKDAFAKASAYLKAAGRGKLLLTGQYRLSVTKGTNDKYGANFSGDNITIEGTDGATLQRYGDPVDISTYALSFPILLFGTPDSDVAAATTNIKVTGVEFIGEDTRHAVGGSALMDGRQAIWLKNCKTVRILDNTFSKIDSGAIYVQRPGSYDYENSGYYNKTKCYDIKVFQNTFRGEPHATAGRALMHTVEVRADNINVSHNHFEWCDVCINTTSTYDDYEDKETDTYTDSNLSASVKRAGRGTVFSNNTIYNSSEHSIYLNGMNEVASQNVINIDDITVCNAIQIQIRGRNISIAGNSMTGVNAAVNITTGSKDVSVCGNTISCAGDTSGGVINIQSQGLTSYIDNRSDFYGSYIVLENVSVTGNTITFPTTAQTNGLGIRIYTDTSDANYNTDGQMHNINISSNTFNNVKKGIHHLTPLARNISIKGNTFNGKPFTESGFSTGTSMDSLYVIGVNSSQTTALQEVEFDNNRVYGFEYIFYDNEGTGSAGSIRIPLAVRSNRFRYVKYWDTAAFVAPDKSHMVMMNKGQSFLDRLGWKTKTAILNSLDDGSSYGALNSMYQMNGLYYIDFFHDDSGTAQSAARSDGDTGGTGSAGAGNQYIEIAVGNNYYKVLHDGTV